MLKKLLSMSIAVTMLLASMAIPARADDPDPLAPVNASADITLSVKLYSTLGSVSGQGESKIDDAVDELSGELTEGVVVDPTNPTKIYALIEAQAKDATVENITDLNFTLLYDTNVFADLATSEIEWVNDLGLTATSGNDSIVAGLNSALESELEEQKLSGFGYFVEAGTTDNVASISKDNPTPLVIVPLSVKANATIPELTTALITFYTDGVYGPIAEDPDDTLDPSYTVTADEESSPIGFTPYQVKIADINLTDALDSFDGSFTIGDTEFPEENPITEVEAFEYEYKLEATGVSNAIYTGATWDGLPEALDGYLTDLEKDDTLPTDFTLTVSIVEYAGYEIAGVSDDATFTVELGLEQADFAGYLANLNDEAFLLDGGDLDDSFELDADDITVPGYYEDVTFSLVKDPAGTSTDVTITDPTDFDDVIEAIEGSGKGSYKLTATTLVDGYAVTTVTSEATFTVVDAAEMGPEVLASMFYIGEVATEVNFAHGHVFALDPTGEDSINLNFDMTKFEESFASYSLEMTVETYDEDDFTNDDTEILLQGTGTIGTFEDVLAKVDGVALYKLTATATPSVGQGTAIDLYFWAENKNVEITTEYELAVTGSTGGSIDLTENDGSEAGKAVTVGFEDEIVIDVTFDDATFDEKTLTGIAGFTFDLEYDHALFSLESITFDDDRYDSENPPELLLNEITHAAGVGNKVVVSYSNDVTNLPGSLSDNPVNDLNSLISKNILEEGSLAKLTFTVRGEAGKAFPGEEIKISNLKFLRFLVLETSSLTFSSAEGTDSESYFFTVEAGEFSDTDAPTDVEIGTPADWEYNTDGRVISVTANNAVPTELVLYAMTEDDIDGFVENTTLSNVTDYAVTAKEIVEETLKTETPAITAEDIKGTKGEIAISQAALLDTFSTTVPYDGLFVATKNVDYYVVVANTALVADAEVLKAADVKVETITLTGDSFTITTSKGDDTNPTNEDVTFTITTSSDDTKVPESKTLTYTWEYGDVNEFTTGKVTTASDNDFEFEVEESTEYVTVRAVSAAGQSVYVSTSIKLDVVPPEFESEAFNALLAESSTNSNTELTLTVKDKAPSDGDESYFSELLDSKAAAYYSAATFGDVDFETFSGASLIGSGVTYTAADADTSDDTGTFTFKVDGNPLKDGYYLFIISDNAGNYSGFEVEIDLTESANIDLRADTGLINDGLIDVADNAARLNKLTSTSGITLLEAIKTNGVFKNIKIQLVQGEDISLKYVKTTVAGFATDLSAAVTGTGLIDTEIETKDYSDTNVFEFIPATVASAVEADIYILVADNTQNKEYYVFAISNMPASVNANLETAFGATEPTGIVAATESTYNLTDFVTIKRNLNQSAAIAVTGGALSGDVSGDLKTTATDILKMIRVLKESVPRRYYGSDDDYFNTFKEATPPAGN